MDDGRSELWSRRALDLRFLLVLQIQFLIYVGMSLHRLFGRSVSVSQLKRRHIGLPVEWRHCGLTNWEPLRSSTRIIFINANRSSVIIRSSNESPSCRRLDDVRSIARQPLPHPVSETKRIVFASSEWRKRLMADLVTNAHFARPRDDRTFISTHLPMLSGLSHYTMDYVQNTIHMSRHQRSSVLLEIESSME